MNNTANIPSDCPFCLSNNLLKSNVIAKTNDAYLIENMYFPGNYLILPNEHIESPFDLSDTWWQDVKKLLAHTPVKLEDYNISFNIGKIAGQTIKHLHLWIVPRAADQPSSGRGLVGLIHDCNELSQVN